MVLSLVWLLLGNPSLHACFHLPYLPVHMQAEMDAKNAQVQQQLQERDTEINKLRRDLRALREHIVRVHNVSYRR